MFNLLFEDASRRAAHRFDKRMFYAALYGSADGFQVLEDFFMMYVAGGPLDRRG